MELQLLVARSQTIKALREVYEALEEEEEGREESRAGRFREGGPIRLEALGSDVWKGHFR